MSAREIVAAAEQRSSSAVAQGISDLRRQAESAPEWSEDVTFAGQRHVAPKRALLVGMLAHLERSSASEALRRAV